MPAMLKQVPMALPQPAPDRTLPAPTHRVVIAADGAVTLDGCGVTGASLAAIFAAIRADRQASLVIASDGDARYDAFVQTLAVVKRAGITRLGFEGNRGLGG